MDNRKSKIITTAVAAAFLAVISSVILISAYATPGDEQNPLITKDYLDSVVNSLVEENNSLSSRVESLEGNTSDPFDGTEFESRIESRISEAIEKNQKGYKTVTFEYGKTVDLSEGTEFIIRTGFATAKTASSSAGLYDLTDGKVIPNGESVTSGHYIVATRGDRGIYCRSDCTVLIRGEYTVV